MNIGELARAAGCPVETIRYYERAALLPAPARTTGNYRHYAPAAIERLAFIRRCRSLDMSLDEIRSLLAVIDAPDSDCRAADAAIDAHLAHIAQRLRELRALQTQLRDIRAACASPGAAADCGVLRQLRDGRRDEAADTGHVAGTHRAAPSTRKPRAS